MSAMKRVNGLYTSVIIAAAGSGTRMDMDINKQYIEIDGMPVLARTLQAFQHCESIDEIILVVNSQDIIYCKQNIIDAYGIDKVDVIVAGGDTRQRSVYNGLTEVNKGCDILIVHDGARPFVKEKSILDSIDTAYQFGAASVAVPVKDTIKVVNKDGVVVETLDRSTLWSIQTPQAFRYDLILEAHEKAIEDDFLGTDDAMLLERIGYEMKIVMGSYDNIKITTKEDLAIAECIVKSDF